MTRRFVQGTNQSTAQKQFEINPKLQRTQATGNRQGNTLGTAQADYPVKQDGQVVLPNRAVPQNFKFKKVRKVPPQVINTFQVPTVKSKGGFE